MHLHEYQAKALFHRYGMPVPRHRVASNPVHVRQAAEALIADTVVVKVQVHSDGRTRAGGVKLVDTPREAEDYARAMLGSRLVTESSKPKGKLINTVLIEETCLVSTELYLSIRTDPATLKTIVTVARESYESDIEEHAADPLKHHVYELAVNRRAGIQSYQYRQLCRNLKLTKSLSNQFSSLLKSLSKLFFEKDLTLAEINPLVITEQGSLICLDGKIAIDKLALRRHKEFRTLRDKTQETSPELPRRTPLRVGPR